jgi:glyoxylase-like metal-dependent hydrolase (beta-lactamase superfamily II)
VGHVVWREVDDRVFVRRHQSYDLNVGLVVGDGGCLVIDTREHLAAGRELAEAVRRVTPSPWAIVNTHAHFDHFMGNAAFVPADIWSLERARQVIEEYADDARPPNRTFSGGRVTLDVGGRAVTLHHLGRGHTDNDVVLTVAGCSALFAGDLVEEGAPPAFEDAYPIAWGGTVDALLDLVAGPVVPGHGDVVDESFVREQRGLHARVASAARGVAATVAGLPDDVAALALARARAELSGALA